MLHMPTPMLMGGEPTDPYNGAYVVLDFAGVKNGGAPFYRVNGVTYASAAAAGFTGTGTLDASGYTATGTQYLSGTVDLGSGDFIVFAEFSEADTSATRSLWRHYGSGTPTILRVASSGAYIAVPSAGVTATTATTIATGRVGGVGKASVNGGAVTSQAGASTAPGSGQLVIGNVLSPSDVPWTAAIRRFAIYKSTLNDAQIQALGA